MALVRILVAGVYGLLFWAVVVAIAFSGLEANAAVILGALIVVLPTGAMFVHGLVKRYAAPRMERRN